MTKPERFKQITTEMSDLYARKNHDYGDSFGTSIQKYGPIAGITRISDKFNRLENLMINTKRQVNDESISDTLLDLASYAIMLYMEMNQPKEAKDEEIIYGNDKPVLKRELSFDYDKCAWEEKWVKCSDESNS